MKADGRALIRQSRDGSICRPKRRDAGNNGGPTPYLPPRGSTCPHGGLSGSGGVYRLYPLSSDLGRLPGQSRPERLDPRRDVHRHRARDPAGLAAFPRGALGQHAAPDREGLVAPSPPVLLAPMAAFIGNRAGQSAFHRRDPLAARFHRRAPRRGPRDPALHRRPAGLPRPARHLLGPHRHRRLGRPHHLLVAAPGRIPPFSSTS